MTDQVTSKKNNSLGKFSEKKWKNIGTQSWTLKEATTEATNNKLNYEKERFDQKKFTNFFD